MFSKFFNIESNDFLFYSISILIFSVISFFLGFSFYGHIYA